jgi:hypothetical protein
MLRGEEGITIFTWKSSERPKGICDYTKLVVEEVGCISGPDRTWSG